ncbi:flagellar basal body rod protein FlgC [Bacillus lacus]|uniref:Flagellar basal-body rod protein FlgC n=1 Tax=Metabacillus lacus TaxID=1983721 RepID=A0A7X2IVR6_9BACI|nr:flagellar basal body rod protein FlgC [Metabacillus lacus]MRX70589.1 flagellar basal body rod protein FlgC [Metabacillus lacus]
MSIFSSLNTTASALTAQRLRMDIISSNMANVETTRGVINEEGQWEPYRRKMAVLEPKGQSFSSMLHHARGGQANPAAGVVVSAVKEDSAPFKKVFDPGHPDAGPDGFVNMPNVDPLKEMVDLMGSTRSYEANVTVFNASKSMLLKSLELGK